MKHNFEERKQQRIDNAKQRAAQNEIEGDRLYNTAKEMASVIPLGQPILVGHHSEKRDRSYRNKIHNTYGKAFEKMDKAKYYQQKAEIIEGNTAISSDDPHALSKLKGQLQLLENAQEFRKATNKLLKKKDREGFLKLPLATAKMWEELINPAHQHWGIGFASYLLKNNGANIRRIKARIAQLEQIAQLETKEILINEVRIVQNTEANRTQLFFNDRLTKEEYKQVRSMGFVWCKSESAFQRQLCSLSNRRAIDYAKKFRTANPQ